MVFSNGIANKYGRQHGKYQSLDKTDENFQTDERERCQNRNKKRHDCQKNLSGEDIAE